jgi:predicted protein tyrosine phosphatase
MIVVSSYSSAEKAFRHYKPRFVVSILDRDEGPAPSFEGLPADNHLYLCGDCSSADPDQTRSRQLVDLARRWDRKEPILIHCHQGVARSMAAAYIILCAVEEGRCEAEIAKRLRKAAPHADPNLLLISEADALMRRDDRMVEAILDMQPCSGAVCNDVVTLPLAA